MRVCWNIEEVVAAIAAAEVAGPLRVRTVVVSSMRIAHALRRELVTSGREAALLGTRFVMAATLANEVLECAGVLCRPGEEALREGRIAAAIAGGLALEYFDARLVAETPGWEAAFARTIGDLERAGLSAAALLDAATDGRERDVAAIWSAVDEAADASWTGARILNEAATRLSAGEGARAIDAPVFALISGSESAGTVAFLRAIPGIDPLLLAARPVSPRFLERVASAWGPDTAELVSGSPSPRSSASRREALASWLFEDPDVRPPSAPPDDTTVAFEEHAGIEDELTCAAEWVTREIVERRTPLSEIAVLLPELDPVAEVLAARLARAGVAVHVAGGLPLSSTAAGARALALLDALAEGLPPERLVEILPSLRAECESATHVSRDESLAALTGIGAIGARIEEDPLTLRRRLAERLALLRAETEAPETGPREHHRRRESERLLVLLDRLTAPLDALFALDERVRAGAPLAELVPSVLAFLRMHLLSPGGDGPHVAERIAPALEPLATSAPASGPAAMRAIAAAAHRTRAVVGRFGEPAVFVGTIRSAAGIPFRAVRIQGLCEGAFPGSVHEDPVLPDAFRARLSPAIHRAADRPLDEARALHRVLLDTRGTVVLSTPRSDFDRTVHEPSTLFLEAAATLRPGNDVPSLSVLRRDFFAPARASHERFRLEHPLGDAGALHRAAHTRAIPAAWNGVPALDRARLAALRDGAAPAGPPDGLLDPAHLTAPPRGLTPERPISASGLQKLLQCPHKFLLEDVLHWDEPAELPSARDVGPLRYGTLFHSVLERFFREHGGPFSRREHAVPNRDQLPPFWENRAREIIGLALDELVQWFPLDPGALEWHQNRLIYDVLEFLRPEWQRDPARAFVDAERAFGWDEPFALTVGGRPLYVRGFIDRIDVEDGTALVRDLKTGRPHPRTGDEAGPTAVRDVQIAVYGLVTRTLAAAWNVPATIGAAYTYAGPWGSEERAFRGGDAAELLREGVRWLELALDLLESRSFPRTPLEDDCGFCSFRPVCGAGATDRARALLEQAPAGSPLARFLDLKRRQDGEEAA